MMRGAKIVKITPFDISVEVDAEIVEGFGDTSLIQAGTSTAAGGVGVGLGVACAETSLSDANARFAQTMIAPAAMSFFINSVVSAPSRTNEGRGLSTNQVQNR